jgi:hypothetical protein
VIIAPEMPKMRPASAEMFMMPRAGSLLTINLV